jgi:hypothetical protein
LLYLIRFEKVNLLLVEMRDQLRDFWELRELPCSLQLEVKKFNSNESVSSTASVFDFAQELKAPKSEETWELHSKLFAPLSTGYQYRLSAQAQCVGTIGQRRVLSTVTRSKIPFRLFVSIDTP